MKKYIGIITILILNSIVHAQDWVLKLSSNVELRKWKLTDKAIKDEKVLRGAHISLYKGTHVIGNATSDANGDFTIDLPAKGDFILTISHAGCATKKFSVSTNGVPESVGKDKFKPTVAIGGFVISKPISGVNYIGLNEPLLKVEYKSKGQNFDKDEVVTAEGLKIISKISAAENSIIEKFCALNKMGDEALKKKKCEAANDYYTKAKILIPDEKYPIEQLVKAKECIEAKKSEQELANDLASQKAEIAKVAHEKAIKKRQDKDNISFKKGQKKELVQETKTENVTTFEAENATTTELIEQKTTPNYNTVKNGGSKSKYKMRCLLGADKYKEAICKADDYYKRKRYKEAKEVYIEALKLKSNDTYSQDKIVKCDKLLGPKS